MQTQIVRPKKILLVEDEAGVRDLIKRLLEKEGYAVVEANNGAEAFALFRSGRFDLVVTDFEMPFVKGDGVFIGPEAVVTNVFMQLPLAFDGFKVVVTDVFGEGNKVVMVGYYQGTNKVSGRPFKANATHIWTVKNGKITHFFQAVDTTVLNR